MIFVHPNQENSNLSYIDHSPFHVDIPYPQTISLSRLRHRSSSTLHYLLTKPLNCNNANNSSDYHFGQASCAPSQVVNDIQLLLLPQSTIPPTSLSAIHRLFHPFHLGHMVSSTTHPDRLIMQRQKQSRRQARHYWMSMWRR